MWATPALHAQTANTGAISGTVTDPSGAVVPGAQIKVTNAATGEVRTVKSTGRGLYVVPQLSPGTYTLDATQTGFKTANFPRLQVSVTDTLPLNIHLALGSTTETVTVEEAGQQLQVDSSTLGRVTSGIVVNNLPLVSRNYTQIIALNPGVASEVTNAGELGRGGGSDQSDAIVANGGSNNDNNFQMNGVEINDLQHSGSFSGGVATPNPDTIQEFKVQTSQYDASYGRNAGANVDVITKGGSNEFHGNLFEFFRNEALNANDYFRKLNKQPRPELRQNQFGMTFGGPIVKDKLLFFTSYQGTRQKNGVDANCSSNFSSPVLTDDRSAAALGTLFGGQSGAVGGTAVAPDGSNISPQALALLNLKLPSGQYLIPTPQSIKQTASGPQGFSSFSTACPFNEEQIMGNMDYTQSEKSTFYARYFMANSHQIDTFPFANLGGSTGPGFPFRVDQRFRNASLTHNYVFSSTLLNQAEIGYHRQVSNSQQSTAFNFSDIGAAVPAFDNTIPEVFIQGALTLGGNGQGVAIVQNTYVAQDTISWVHGRHSFQFGGGVSRAHNNLESFHYIAGLLFLSFPDFLLGESGAQNGTPFSNIYGSVDLPGLFPRQYRVWDGNAYVQDNFKVTPRLTLNLGFRWEKIGDIGDDLGRNSLFDPARANPNPPATGSFDGFVVSSNYKGGPLPPGVVSSGNNLAIRGDHQNTINPRVGFAWRLPGVETVVLRGGYGIYHSRLTGQPFLQLLTAQPFSLLRQFVGPPNVGATWANPLPLDVPTLPSFTPYSPTTDLTLNSFSQDFRPAITQRYSLNIQSEMGKDFVAEIGYVGARGTHLFRTRSPNQAQLASAADPIRGETTNTLANIPLRVPLQGWDAQKLLLTESEGASWYNAFEASLNKRFTHGLQFLASYTWSRFLSTDLTTATGPNGGVAYGNQNDPRGRYGPDSFIRPNRFVLSGIYELPGPRFRTSLLGEAIGGWKLSGVLTWQDGHQLAITETNPTNVFGILNDFAQFAPGCTAAQAATSGSIQKRLTNYINASCFTTQPIVGDDGVATGFGNTRPGILNGPGQFNTDLALGKSFGISRLKEGANVEFRAEAFNLFNHPQFADPDTEFTSATFGQIQTTAVAPRVMQIALKLNF
ncbi:MAG: TonB-dependent receptor [Acidobacteriaceae bacterium]